MPVYEFRCADCGKNFSLVKSISQYGGGAVKCPKCGKKKTERRWSQVYTVTSKKS